MYVSVGHISFYNYYMHLFVELQSRGNKKDQFKLLMLVDHHIAIAYIA